MAKFCAQQTWAFECFLSCLGCQLSPAAILAVLRLGVISAAAVCAPRQAEGAGSRDLLRQVKVEIPCYRTQRPGERLGKLMPPCDAVHPGRISALVWGHGEPNTAAASDSV